jgi:hypothetical protein
VHFEDYLAFAPRWRDQVANGRIHGTSGRRSVDRFKQVRWLLRKLPVFPFDIEEVVPAFVSPMRGSSLRATATRHHGPGASARRDSRQL